MQYKIMFTRTALKEFVRLPEQVRKQVSKKLTKLAEGPFNRINDVKKLHDVEDSYRLRSGDYRVVYIINGKKLIITVIKVAHRKEVYK